MHKIKLFVILLGITLIGCTKVENEALERIENNEIAFVTATQLAQTKATTAFDKAKTFNVYGLYTGAAKYDDLASFESVARHMDNVEIGYGDGAWKCQTKNYYWPKSGNLSFIGYAPSVANIALGSSREKALEYDNYDVEGNYEAQTDGEDLLISKVAKDNTSTPSPVVIEFKHALSAIKFSAKAASLGDGITYHIVFNGISIDGIYNHADFTFNSVENQSIWDVLTSYDRINSGAIFDGENTLQMVGDTFVGNDNELTLEENFFGTLEKVYYALPQLLDEDMVVELGFTIYSCNSEGKILDVSDVATEVALNAFGGKNLSQWESGKSYTYNIVINPESSNLITFEPIVVDWDEEYSDDDDSEEEEEGDEESGDNQEEDEQNQGDDNQNEGGDENQGGDNQNDGDNQQGGGQNQGGDNQQDGDNQEGQNQGGNDQKHDNGNNNQDNNGKNNQGGGNGKNNGK